MNMNPRPGLEYCHSVISDVSRTFALSIEQVGKLLSDYTCISYLLCRIPDTIEDTYSIPNEKKREFLKQYDEILNKDRLSNGVVKNFVESTNRYGEGGPCWDLVQNAERVFSVFGTFPMKVRTSVRFHITKMVRGIRDILGRDSNKTRISDMGEFSEYCYHVAGTVGDMLTELFQITEGLTQNATSKLRKYSHSFGEALQSVNIVKDVYDDFEEENSIYIPQSLLKKYGTSHERMFVDKEGTLRAIDELNRHAASKLEDAEKYISILPTEAKDARHFVIIPYLLAVSTLREIREREEELLEPASVKISRSEVFAILDRLPRCVEDNRYLKELAYKAKKNEITDEVMIKA